MNTRGPGDTVQEINARVLFLLLNAAQIRAVDPGIISQLLLRNAAIYTDPAHISGQKRTSVHAQSHSDDYQTTGYSQTTTISLHKQLCCPRTIARCSN